MRVSHAHPDPHRFGHDRRPDRQREPDPRERAAATVTARDLSDCVVGGAGNDTINGGAGTDVCIGGPGTDTFTACETSYQ